MCFGGLEGQVSRESKLVWSLRWVVLRCFGGLEGQVSLESKLVWSLRWVVLRCFGASSASLVVD